jgi:hypothetical protein
MAFLKGSDYEATPDFTPDEEGRSDFLGIRARPLRRTEAVLEHTVRRKERLDSLAWNYYGDSRGWRVLAESNVDLLFPEDLVYERAEGGASPRNRVGAVVLVGRKREDV